MCFLRDLISQALVQKKTSLQTQLHQARAELIRTQSREDEKAMKLQELTEKVKLGRQNLKLCADCLCDCLKFRHHAFSD